MGKLADLLRRGLEAGDRGDLDTVMAMADPEVELIDPTLPAPARGKAEVRAALEQIRRAFPDERVTVRHVIEGDGWIAAEVTFTGTNLGPLRGPQGEAPATGKRVTIEACHVMQTAGDKILRYRIYLDTMSVLAQLGLVPAAATSGR